MLSVVLVDIELLLEKASPLLIVGVPVILPLSCSFSHISILRSVMREEVNLAFKEY